MDDACPVRPMKKESSMTSGATEEWRKKVRKKKENEENDWDYFCCSVCCSLDLVPCTVVAHAALWANHADSQIHSTSE